MLINDAVFGVLDCETTGLNNETDAIVEVAMVSTKVTSVTGMFATLVNPEMPIPPDVSAIHMLTDADVADAIPRHEALEQTTCFADAMGVVCAIAHNAAFDEGFIERAGVNLFTWGCTKRLAQHIWPDAPSFRNQALRYWRKLKADTFGILPHRALADALVTAALLRDLLTCAEFEQMNIDTLDGLLALAKSPILLKNWPKGKFFGKPIATADIDYIEWCISSRGMTDMDADFRYTLETELRQRKGGLVL